MPVDLVLASGSASRAALLRQAGLIIETEAPRLDESLIKDAMRADGAPPRDIADALAQAKAAKVAARRPADLVLGCDQVLDLDGEILSKPLTREDAAEQIRRLSGKTHKLLSAAVLFEGGEPVWRHVGMARLSMRSVSDAYLTGYLDRNWPSVSESVGGYKLEEEGVRLFERIEGSYFTILGLPLLELLGFLSLRGSIAS